MKNTFRRIQPIVEVAKVAKVNVGVRCSPQQKEQLKMEAEICGLSLSEYSAYKLSLNVDEILNKKKRNEK